AEAEGHLDAAAAAYRVAAMVDGIQPKALVGLAKVELARGEAESAVDAAETLIEAWPDHPDDVPIAVEAHIRTGELEEARPSLAAALVAHPYDLGRRSALGRLQLAAKGWAVALEVLEAATKRAPKDASVEVDLGGAAFHAEKIDRAKAAYEAAL